MPTQHPDLDNEFKRVVDHCRGRFAIDDVAVTADAVRLTLRLQFTGEDHEEVVARAKTCEQHLRGHETVDAFDGNVGRGIIAEYPAEEGFKSEVRVSKPTPRQE